MVTEVSICNMALSRLGAGSFISSLDEKSNEARLASLNYTPARDETLAAYPWPFAMRRKTLAALDEEPPAGFSAVLTYPSDCLFPRALLGAGGAPLRFETGLSASAERRVILSDEPAAVLAYTARVANPALFDPLFTLALSVKLAGALAPALTGKVELAAFFDQAFRNLVLEAEAASANSSAPAPAADAEWIRARG